MVYGCGGGGGGQFVFRGVAFVDNYFEAEVASGRTFASKSRLSVQDIDQKARSEHRNFQRFGLKFKRNLGSETVRVITFLKKSARYFSAPFSSCHSPEFLIRLL